MINITHYQGNANQNHNHNEVPSHTGQMAAIKMLERVWRKGNPLALLVGMQTSAATMGNSVEIP